MKAYATKELKSEKFATPEWLADVVLAKTDRAARARVVAAMQPFVWSVVRKIWARRGCLEDWAQEANLGLLLAIDRFDPKRGDNFTSYARWWICARIYRHDLFVMAAVVSLGSNWSKEHRAMWAIRRGQPPAGMTDDEARSLKQAVARPRAIVRRTMALNVRVGSAQDRALDLKNTITEESLGGTAHFDLDRAVDLLRAAESVKGGDIVLERLAGANLATLGKRRGHPHSWAERNLEKAVASMTAKLAA